MRTIFGSGLDWRVDRAGCSVTARLACSIIFSIYIMMKNPTAILRWPAVGKTKKHRKKTKKAGALSTQKRFEYDLHSSVQRRAEDELEQQVLAQQQQVQDEQLRDIEARLNALQEVIELEAPVAQAVEEDEDDFSIGQTQRLNDLMARLVALQQHEQQNQHIGGRKHRRKRKTKKRRKKRRRKSHRKKRTKRR